MITASLKDTFFAEVQKVKYLLTKTYFALILYLDDIVCVSSMLITTLLLESIDDQVINSIGYAGFNRSSVPNCDVATWKIIISIYISIYLIIIIIHYSS